VAVQMLKMHEEGGPTDAFSYLLCFNYWSPVQYKIKIWYLWQRITLEKLKWVLVTLCGFLSLPLCVIEGIGTLLVGAMEGSCCFFNCCDYKYTKLAVFLCFIRKISV